MTEPIRQRIEVDNAASPELRQVAQDMGHIEQAERAVATEAVSAAAAGRELGQAHRDLRQELVRLVREQLEYEQALRDGVQVDQAAASAARDRAQQINQIAGQLARQEQAERRAAEEVRRHSGAAESMIESWGKFLAVAGSIIATLDSIADRAKKAAQSSVDAGQMLAELAGNIGGQQASINLGKASVIAAEELIGVEGRRAIIEGLTAVTDVQPELSSSDTTAWLRDLAGIYRATGKGGADVAEAVLAATKHLGVDRPGASNLVADLLSGGWDAGLITQVAESGGDLDTLALVRAAQQQGLNIRRTGRSLPAIIQQLNRRDPGTGELAADLQGVGITDQMSDVQKIQQIIAARQAGHITTGQYEQMIGGADAMRFFRPIEAALAGGGLEAARASLSSPDVIDQLIARREQSPEIRAMQREQQRKLRELVGRETSSMAGYGEVVREIETGLDEFAVGRAINMIPGSSQVMAAPIGLARAVFFDAQGREENLERKTAGSRRATISAQDREVHDALRRDGARPPGPTAAVTPQALIAPVVELPRPGKAGLADRDRQQRLLELVAREQDGTLTDAEAAELAELADAARRQRAVQERARQLTAPTPAASGPAPSSARAAEISLLHNQIQHGVVNHFHGVYIEGRRDPVTADLR